MDARTSDLLPLSTENHLEKSPLRINKPFSQRPVRVLHQEQPTKKSRPLGREVVKSAMAASLAVTMLTGLKVLRPMSMHPVASWVFLGLTVLHMLTYEKPIQRSSKKYAKKTA